MFIYVQLLITEMNINEQPSLRSLLSFKRNLMPSTCINVSESAMNTSPHPTSSDKSWYHDRYCLEDHNGKHWIWLQHSYRYITYPRLQSGREREKAIEFPSGAGEVGSLSPSTDTLKGLTVVKFIASTVTVSWLIS